MNNAEKFKKVFGFYATEMWAKPEAEFLEWIKAEAPTVDTEPIRHGKWVDIENEPYCECSACGSYIDNLDDDYAFCPRCGAKMDKEK